jgi:hypothetical protein
MKKRKSAPKLQFIPMSEVRVINNLEELADYLVSEQWMAGDQQAYVVLREDVNGLYVFGWARFLELGVKALKVARAIQKSGLTPLRARKLQDALNIHETTVDAVVQPHETAVTRAAVVNGKSGAELTAIKLNGVWVPSTEIEFPVMSGDHAHMQKETVYVEMEGLPSHFDPEPLFESEASLFGETGRRRSASELSELSIGETVPAAEQATHPTVTHQILRRTPHMDLSKEDPLAPGDHFEVAIYADEVAARPDELSEDIFIEAPADIDEFPLTVHLVATDHFAITGPQSQALTVKTSESQSEVVTFSLEVTATPKSVRAGTIVAAFEYKGRPCGKVVRSVSIAPKDAAAADSGSSDPNRSTASSGSEGPRIEIIANTQQPDMTITIVNPSNDGRNFDVVVTTPLLDGYKAGVKGLWSLKNVSSEIVSGYFQEFTKDNITQKKRLDALLGAGEELFKSTPEHFRKAFWQIIDDNLPLHSIFVVSQEPFIPWELMIPARFHNGKDDIREALGAMYSVGRWVCEDNISPGQLFPLAQSQVIAPDYRGSVPKKLLKAQAEADFVRSNFNGQAISPAAYPVFDAAMQTSTATLLHFVCHGAAQTPVAQQIYLEDGILSSVQLGGNRAFRAACRKNKPLIFLNACEVGRPQPALVGIGGFAQTFIERGAQAVVSPLWSVKDDLAYEVAMSFYEAAKKQPGRPFGDIVREIRAKAYDIASGAEDTYAAYCFYGDPLAHGVAA